MKPVAFKYYRPQDLDEVLELLDSHGDEATVLAGGQSLVPMLNMRLARPSIVVDIGGLSDQLFIEQKNGMVCIGCCVTQRDLQDWGGLADVLPLVDRVIPFVGHAQTRNRGTVVGSIAHADPSAELPLCMAALGGQAVLVSVRGERMLDVESFQLGMLATACQADEIIREVRFPEAIAGTKVSFAEEAPRHGDFAIVSVAAVADPSGVTIAFGGIGDGPIVHCFSALNKSDIVDALAKIGSDCDPQNDQHASSEYRRHLLQNLGYKVIREVLS